MSASNGGISQLASVALMPMIRASTGQAGFYAFDPLFGFNDPVAPSVHSFRVEEIIPGRVPTVSNLIVTYRDLGLVTVTFSLSGTSSGTDGLDTIVNSQVSMPWWSYLLPSVFLSNTAAQATVTLGTPAATNRLFTRVIGIGLSAQNLQLTITRAANAGPLSIAKLVMAGKVEAQKYAG